MTPAPRTPHVGDGAMWTLSLLRRETGPTPVRVAVRGHAREVEIAVGAARPLVLEVRELAELIETLRAAGRAVRANQAAATIAREYAPRRDQWAPIMSAEDLDDDLG